MLPANGLYGHIQKNTMKSALLLVSFVVLIWLFWYAWCVIYSVVVDHVLAGYAPRPRRGYGYQETDLWHILDAGLVRALDRWMIPLIIAGGWFIIAYFAHADLIRAATRARPVSRTEQPRLYKIVERVAINAGLPMPRVEIINSGALNAYAAGLSPEDSVVAVTWGLLQTLNDDELEAVIAHEITHIKNYDVRLMVIATVFTGGLTLLGQAVAGWVSAGAPGAEYGAVAALKTGASAATNEESEGRATAILVSVAIAVVFLALTHLFAILINLAISRSREYMADAGAVELTKNPDAMISALQKISENDEVPDVAPSTQAMMISCSSISGLFSTHPEVADRIAALQKYAGGRVMAPRPRRASVTATQIGAAAPIAAPAGAVGFGRRRASPLPRR